MHDKAARIEPMPDIPDRQIDEIIADPEAYTEKTYRLRYQEAREWIDAEMAEAERRYNEQRLGRRILRALRSLTASAEDAA